VKTAYGQCPPFLFQGNVVLPGWTPGKGSVTFDLWENSFTLTHSEKMMGSAEKDAANQLSLATHRSAIGGQ